MKVRLGGINSVPSNPHEISLLSKKKKSEKKMEGVYSKLVKLVVTPKLSEGNVMVVICGKKERNFIGVFFLCFLVNNHP